MEDGVADGLDWRALNRANWDERVAVHLGPRGYDLARLRAGKGRLHPIEEAELPPLAGRRVLHLQCHFGADTLTLAQRGAVVVGLDFSAAAIAAARALAQELKLADRARFVEADLYAAPAAIDAQGGFDLVFVTWGAIGWLPDIAAWAGIVAHFLKPGGRLYLAEGHPAALVLDDAAAGPDGRPGFLVPYLGGRAMLFEDERDYADPEARLANRRTVEWLHPLGAVVTALIEAGLTLDWLHEHDCVPWRMFQCLVERDGMFRWPDRPWLPLAYSLSATRPAR
jgi:SAM-dependent methyltransferase